jgi:hypothetical protein
LWIILISNPRTQIDGVVTADFEINEIAINFFLSFPKMESFSEPCPVRILDFPDVEDDTFDVIYLIFRQPRYIGPEKSVNL